MKCNINLEKTTSLSNMNFVGNIWDNLSTQLKKNNKGRL